MTFFPLTCNIAQKEFCLPNLFVWYPEALWQSRYPDARPACKWHGTTECVCRRGWMDLPWHGHSHHRMTAVLGRKYYCSKRKAQGIKPFNFRNIDPKVIANEPDYVKVQWERSGFDFLHRSGLSMPLLKGVRYSLNYGLGVQGFQQTLKENLK